MPKIDQPVSLPLATIEAIVTAANANAGLSPESMEGLRSWLSDHLNKAIRRVTARPLDRPDVDRLDKALRHFLKIIDDLQGCYDPPPKMPVSESGATDWDNWIAVYQHIGFKQGAPDGRDWSLIGALLALYEVTSNESASGANERNPTMNFLERALGKLARHTPPEVRKYLELPEAGTLDKQMPKLREQAMPAQARRLAKIIGSGKE